MKKRSAKPPSRRQTSSGTARQAPEAAVTSRGPGAAASGSSCIPAQTIPVKWTGLPAELIVVPSSPATRPCQADQPRPSSQGRRIASPHPGSGIASGLRMTKRSPVALLAPTSAPPAKPRLRPIVTIFAAGASSRRDGRRVVGRVVVDDDQLVAVAQLRQQRRQRTAQLGAAVPGDDQDGDGRTHRRGG